MTEPRTDYPTDEELLCDAPLNACKRCGRALPPHGNLDKLYGIEDITLCFLCLHAYASVAIINGLRPGPISIKGVMQGEVAVTTVPRSVWVITGGNDEALGIRETQQDVVKEVEAIALRILEGQTRQEDISSLVISPTFDGDTMTVNVFVRPKRDMLLLSISAEKFTTDQPISMFD